MDIKELRKNWNELGKRDAFGNILTDPMKKGMWDQDMFFKNGEEEISSLMTYIELLKFKIQRTRALDFGCGVGRLTQALCRYFKDCYGIDIAPSMIALANKYNKYGDKCRYFLNESDDLKLFEDGSFDLIYSNIVLQHMKPEYSKKYIKEFLRILKPGGLTIFQIPSEKVLSQNNITQEYDQSSRSLPDSAFKAMITILNSPATIKVNSQKNVVVKVRNISESLWPVSTDINGKYRINLGNHWLNSSGKMLVNDDGRVSIPRDMNPMDEVSLSLIITAPPQEGMYFLELDMVEEGVAWFKDKGSVTTKVRLYAQRSSFLSFERLHSTINFIKSRLLPEKFSPRMEMYAIQKNEAIELIKENGGKIVDVIEYNVAGEDWLSFRYSVTK